MSEPPAGSRASPPGMGALGRNVGTTLLRQVVALLLGLGTTLLLARALGAPGMGQVSQALFLAMLLATLCGLGVPAANVYHVGRRSVSPRQALRTSVALSAALILLGLFVGAPVLAAHHGTLFPGVHPALLALALVLFPLVLLQSLWVSVLHGRQDFRAVNAVGILTPAVVLAVVVVAVAGWGFGPRGALVAAIAGYGVGLAAAVGYLRPHLAATGEAAGTPDYAADAVGYGWKANASNVVSLFNYRVDLYLVNVLLNPAAAGVYTVAMQMAEKLWLLSGATSIVILPRIAELHGAESARRRITGLTARWVLAGTLALAVGVAGAGYPLVRLLGPAYAGSFPTLLALLPGVALLAVSRVVANDLAGRGRPGMNLVTALVTLCVEVVGILLLVPRLGVVGAAVASSVAYAGHTGLTTLFYARVTAQPLLAIYRPTADDRLVLTMLRDRLATWRRGGHGRRPVTSG